jgi:hypothetical protein
LITSWSATLQMFRLEVSRLSNFHTVTYNCRMVAGKRAPDDASSSSKPAEVWQQVREKPRTRTGQCLRIALQIVIFRRIWKTGPASFCSVVGQGSTSGDLGAKKMTGSDLFEGSVMTCYNFGTILEVHVPLHHAGFAGAICPGKHISSQGYRSIGCSKWKTGDRCCSVQAALMPRNPQADPSSCFHPQRSSGTHTVLSAHAVTPPDICRSILTAVDQPDATPQLHPSLDNLEAMRYRVSWKASDM